MTRSALQARNRMKDQGLIPDEDFNTKKRQLLEKF
jgi:hypothetical protein